MRASMRFKTVSFLLLVVVLAPAPARSVSATFNDDVLGLIVFKAGIEDPRGLLGSWSEDEDSPCENWVGVKCNPRSNRVIELDLAGLSLSGKIGRGLFRVQFLRKLSLARNNFTGTLTPNFARLESLRELDLSGNGLSGALSDDLFRQCGSLRDVSLAKNGFSGKIPGSLSSCGSLEGIDLSSNRFSGSVPPGIWSLGGLKTLDLSGNLLEGEIPNGIEMMKNLRTISLQKNRFSGQVPRGIGSCLLLKSLDLSENLLSGNLPEAMQQLSLCGYLNLHRNSFSGGLPQWIGNMKDMDYLDVSANGFSGQVPDSIWNLQFLKVMNFSGNGFSGSLPESMINSPGLTVLDFSHNSLTGTIPTSIGGFKGLYVLDLGENRLYGSIPVEIGGLTSLKELRLENNSIRGKIPNSVGNCSSLTTLNLSHNNLTGSLPAEIGKLSSLENADLSMNGLTGTIPRQLGNLPHLASFNISHNLLEGELPAGGFFNTINPFSVSGNPGLCGAAVNKSCTTVIPKPIVLNPNSTPDSGGSGTVLPSSGRKRTILSVSVLVAIGAAILIVVGVIAITVLNLRFRSATPAPAAAAAISLYSDDDDDFSQSPKTDADSGKLVMFSGKSGFSADSHALLNKDCELGRSGFGAVYRTVLKNGCPVAIKKLTVSSLVKSQEDFEREVKRLGRVRHEHLVALQGYYWTQSLQLLIHEFVPGGSLHNHLHGESGGNGNFCWWDQRFNVILGTARGLAHLHQSKIIHYNIKSSNVLIDEDGHPKVSDFGLAMLLPTLDRYVLSSKIQSALGYMAPEFACKTVKITEKCDVYGFGVLLLEIVSGKRPVEYMEDDVLVLSDIVRGALEEGDVEECIDARLQPLDKYRSEQAVSVIKLGLLCTSQVPSNRPDMGEVVNVLKLIRAREPYL